jgi:hypothetical protein
MKLFVDKIVDGNPYPIGADFIDEQWSKRVAAWPWCQVLERVIDHCSTLQWAGYTEESQGGFYFVYIPDEDTLNSLFPLILSPKRSLVRKINEGTLKLLLFYPFENWGNGWPFKGQTQYDPESLMRRLVNVMDCLGIRRKSSVVVMASAIPTSPLVDERLVLEQRDFTAFLAWWPHDLDHPSDRAFDWSRPKNHMFISLNNKFRPHRYHWIQEIRRIGLSSNVLYSFLDTSPIDGSHDYNNVSCHAASHFMRNNKLGTHNIDNVSYGERIFGQSKCLDDAYVNVVTETIFYEPQFFVTEKTFKSIRAGQPFIIIGPKGILRHLRALGYRTYGEIWDEGYDELDNNFSKISSIAKLVSKIDIDCINKNNDLLKEIGEHNRELFLRTNHATQLANHMKKIWASP